MKIEKIDDSYYIYCYSSIISKDTIYDDIRMVFKRIQRKWHLSGFYKVIVYLRKIGLFMFVMQLEDSFCKDTLDLKIEINDIDDVYFCTEDYFLIKDFKEIRYFSGKYYILVDDSFDQVLGRVEFGSFVFGKRLDLFLKNNVLVE